MEQVLCALTLSLTVTESMRNVLPSTVSSAPTVSAEEIAVFQDVALALDRSFFRVYIDLFDVAVLIGRFRRGTRFAVGDALEPKPRDRPLVGCETEYNWFISHNNPFSVVSD